MWKFWKKTEYQIVLEFPERNEGLGMAFFEQVTAAQLQLAERLQSGEVDGNDVGGRVINLFILTPQPQECFAEAMTHLRRMQLLPAAAGYRDVDGDDYTRLWPENEPSPFEQR